jgi:hypothetical protein
MSDGIKLELLITVVVSATDDRSARASCLPLVRRVNGRIAESADCSDEEPGCWSVTIGRAAGQARHWPGSTALSRAIRELLRELGLAYTRQRIACEFPTAWTVIDDPDLLAPLVTGGERILVEAWGGPSSHSAADPSTGTPEHTEENPAASSNTHGPDAPTPGGDDPRLRLTVDIVTECAMTAEGQAQAIANRLSSNATLIDCGAQPPTMRVRLDLGPATGDPTEIIANAKTALGGHGWSRVRAEDGVMTATWSAAPTPPTGVAVVELSVTGKRGIESSAPSRPY